MWAMTLADCAASADFASLACRHGSKAAEKLTGPTLTRNLRQ